MADYWVMYFILQYQWCSPFDSIKCVCEQGQIGDLTPFWGSPSYGLYSSALAKYGQRDWKVIMSKDNDNLPSLKGLYLLFSWQEVILKRAADLVEALYGMPHNNQVSAVGF